MTIRTADTQSPCFVPELRVFGLVDDPNCIFGDLQLYRSYSYVNTNGEPDVKWLIGHKVYDTYHAFKRAVRRRNLNYFEADHKLNQLLHTHDFSARIKRATLDAVRLSFNMQKQAPIESLRYFYKHNQHEILHRVMPETLDKYDYMLRLVARYRSVGEKRFVWVAHIRETAPSFLAQAERTLMEPEEVASVTSLARDGYVNFRRIAGIILTRSVAYGQEADFFFVYSYTTSSAVTAAHLFCTAAMLMQAMEMTPLANVVSLVSDNHKFRLVNETTRLLTNARTFLQAREPSISPVNLPIGSVPLLAGRFTHLVHYFNNSRGFGEGDEPNILDNPEHERVAAAAAALALSGPRSGATDGPISVPASGAASDVAAGASSAPAEVEEGAASVAQPATARFVRTHARGRMSFLDILESSSDDEATAGPFASRVLPARVVTSVSGTTPATVGASTSGAASTSRPVGPFPSEIVDVSSDSEPEYFPRPDQWIDAAKAKQRTILLLRPPIIYYRDNSVPPADKIAGLQLQLTLAHAALHYSALNVYPYEKLVSKFPAIGRGMMNFGAQVLREVMSGGRRAGNPMVSQVKIICMTNPARRFDDIDINDFVFVVNTATRRAAVERARANSSMTCFVECAKKLVAHTLAFRQEPLVPRFAVRVGGGLNDVSQINIQ